MGTIDKEGICEQQFEVDAGAQSPRQWLGVIQSLLCHQLLYAGQVIVRRPEPFTLGLADALDKRLCMWQQACFTHPNRLKTATFVELHHGSQGSTVSRWRVVPVLCPSDSRRPFNCSDIDAVSGCVIICCDRAMP